MGWAIEYGVINFACHVDVFNDFLCLNTIVNLWNKSKGLDNPLFNNLNNKSHI